MKKLVIIDGNALVHRGYHALPKLTAPDGRLVNAVYGFFLAFLKAMSELDPDCVCACFDRPEMTFRHKKFKDYKAQRPKTPDELAEQIPIVKETLRAMGVPIYEEAGYEADDIIATIAAKNQKSINGLPKVNIQGSREAGFFKIKNQNEKPKFKISQKGALELIVLTGDLDLLQLVDENTKVYFLQRGVKNTVLYDQEKVEKRYGLPPALLADYRALVGDASDNIPGVPGIGPKTVEQLLKKFGSLEGVYKAAEAGGSGIKEKLKKLLLEHKEQAFLSGDLARMRKDVPIDFDFENCAFKGYGKEKTEAVFEELGFKSLVHRLPGNYKKQGILI